nr:tRNA-dihydrouridine synthase family protein [Lachnospiraceae bacterium]
GHIYRNAYHTYFHNIDKFFAPFIVTSPNGIRRMKEFKDILPENNEGLRLIPQLLSNNAEGFILAAREIEALGYEEINLNVGCPSGTVTSKGRGAGLLLNPEELDRFLDRIYRECNMKLSIKTRIGFYKPQEFDKILDIYNSYPVHELIIHPRTREDYYKNPVHLNMFLYAVQTCRHRLCYNGDIFSYQDYRTITEMFPDVDCVMLGRGILRNPSIVENILAKTEKPDRGALFEFHDRIYNDYKSILSGEKHLLFKMKELWLYMAYSLEQSEKFVKKIKKAKNLYEYDSAVNECKAAKG